MLTPGPITAREGLSGLPPMSQQAFSKLIREMSPEVARLGKARNTKYALTRNIERVCSPLCLYRIDEGGRPERVASWMPLHSRGFLVHDESGEEVYFEDLRPAGFLGRLVPLQYSGG